MLAQLHGQLLQVPGVLDGGLVVVALKLDAQHAPTLQERDQRAA